MRDNWCTCRWGDLATLGYGKALRGYEYGVGQYPVYGTNGSIGRLRSGTITVETLPPREWGQRRPKNEGGDGQKRAYMVRVSKHFRRTQRCDRYSSNLLLAVCPCGLRLSSGSPLPISAGLGFLSSTALRYPGSEGPVC